MVVTLTSSLYSDHVNFNVALFNPRIKGVSSFLSVMLFPFTLQNGNTVEPRYLELAYFELPLISKWKSGPCFNMKLWQQVTKQCGKSFPHYFIYIFLTSGVKLHIHLLNVAVQFIVFLTLSTLICRGTDISKYFCESLGLRDNESRLYKISRIRIRASINLLTDQDFSYGLFA